MLVELDVNDISTMRLEYLENDFSPEQTWC